MSPEHLPLGLLDNDGNAATLLKAEHRADLRAELMRLIDDPAG